MNSQDVPICDCGTPFRPGARVCANSACGKPRSQGPRCVYCGIQLFQKAKVCHYCGRSQLQKSLEAQIPENQSRSTPYFYHGEQSTINRDTAGFSTLQTCPTVTRQSQDPQRCVCGTVFIPGAKVCENCWKPRPKNLLQGPPCFYCGKKLMHQSAAICVHCFRRQPSQKLTVEYSSKEQTMLTSNPQPQNLSICVCGAVFHPGARLCANCGKPVPRKQPQDLREREAKSDESLCQGQGLVARMNQLSSELQQKLQSFQTKVDLAKSKAEDAEAQLYESQVCNKLTYIAH